MYTFTNKFTGHSLRQRVVMMNKTRSGRLRWLRYAGMVCSVLIAALGCHWADQVQHRYVYSKNNELYGLITPRTGPEDIDTIKQVLARHHVELVIDTLIRLPDGQINRLALTMKVLALGHPMSTTIGSLSKNSVIPAIGLYCDETGCQLGPVDEKYPERLRELAIQERSSSLPDVSPAGNTFSDANSVFGLYRVFFRNDFLESNYFKYRHTAIRMTPDYHLDLYPEYKNAVIFIDGREADQSELAAFHALDLKKVVVFEGKAAVLRLGDSRAKNGLILLSRLHNIAIRDRYASTRLLDRAYPELFAQP